MTRRSVWILAIICVSVLSVKADTGGPDDEIFDDDKSLDEFITRKLTSFWEDKSGGLKSEIHVLQTNVLRLSATNAMLESKTRVLEEKNKKFEEEFAQIKKTCNINVLTIEDHEERVTTLNSQFHRLNTSLSERLQNGFHDIKSRMSNVETTLSSLTSDLHHFKEKVSEIEHAVNVTEGEVLKKLSANALFAVGEVHRCMLFLFRCSAV